MNIVTRAASAVVQFIDNNGTRILGFALGTLTSIVAVDGIIPREHLKYYLAAISILTYWRGQVTAGRAESMKAALQSQASSPKPP